MYLFIYIFNVYIYLFIYLFIYILFIYTYMYLKCVYYICIYTRIKCMWCLFVIMYFSNLYLYIYVCVCTQYICRVHVGINAHFKSHLPNAAKLQWAVREVSLDLQWLEFVQLKRWKKLPGLLLSSANPHCHCHCPLQASLHNKKSLKLHQLHKLYNFLGTQCTARRCLRNPYRTQRHKPCSHPLHWVRSPSHKYTRPWKPRSSNSDSQTG